MMRLFGSEGIDPFLPQHAGDDGGPAGRHCQQRHPCDVVGVVTGYGAMIEEEQRGRDHCDDSANKTRGHPAQRTRQRHDADEQWRRIGHGHEMTIDIEGDQRHRCRQGRAEDRAPVGLHAFSRLRREQGA